MWVTAVTVTYYKLRLRILKGFEYLEWSKFPLDFLKHVRLSYSSILSAPNGIPHYIGVDIFCVPKGCFECLAFFPVTVRTIFVTCYRLVKKCAVKNRRNIV